MKEQADPEARAERVLPLIRRNEDLKKFGEAYRLGLPLPELPHKMTPGMRGAKRSLGAVLAAMNYWAQARKTAPRKKRK